MLKFTDIMMEEFHLIYSLKHLIWYAIYRDHSKINIYIDLIPGPLKGCKKNNIYCDLKYVYVSYLIIFNNMYFITTLSNLHGFSYFTFNSPYVKLRGKVPISMR
jgi:hypothetical protein